MITVFHISDFHLDSNSLSDWSSYTKKGLIELIKQHGSNVQDTFIICTGDMIDKGGVSNGGVVSALNIFKEQVISPILKETGLSLDHFIILPGNHDINRDADSIYEVAGVRSEFSSKGATEINSYTKKILDGEYQCTKRIIEYNKFAKDLYKDFDNVNASNLGLTFSYENSDGKIGIASFNSAWNAHDDKDQEEGIAIGEPQYNFCKDKLEGCSIKIAAMHHPLEWLKFEKDTIRNWIYSDFQFLYVGHVHTTETYQKSTIFGSLLVDIAPSYTSDIRNTNLAAFINGLTIIDYTPNSKEFICNYYKYSLKSRKYILNNEVGEDGVYKDILPDPSPKSLERIEQNAIKYIKNKQFPNFDNTIIPLKAHAINSLKEAFVKPPIKKHSDNITDYEMQDLFSKKSNILLFGASESGKSVLLYRSLIELTESFAQYNLIPIYLNFSIIGNRDIENIIKEFIDVNSEQCKTLLINERVILLVDNYNPNEENKYFSKKLYDFYDKYKTRIIATSNCQVEDVIPLSFINNPYLLAFEYYHISKFSSEKVRQLMMKWSPKDEFLQRNAKLEKLVSNFCNNSLPCTAMSVSLYLWSTENTNREPVNEAVLLDIYIEIILEKLDLNNAYQNTFDYKNKTMLLAHIAEKIQENKNKNLQYGEYIDLINEYLKRKVGFDKFNSQKIGDYLIERKLFIKTNNEVNFSHSCFYYFFLAQRMKDSEEFKKTILSKDTYYKNDRVISYYSGLVRNDKKLLNFLLDDLNEYFKPAQEIYKHTDIDECFSHLYEGVNQYKPLINFHGTQKVIENKLSREDVEKKLVKTCDEKLSIISDNIRNHQHKTPDLLLSIIANALRNLDGIEDVQLKSKVFEAIIRDSMIFLVVFKDSLADYANKHEHKLPSIYSFITDIEKFFRFLPWGYQNYLYEIIGTTKLSMVYKEKFNADMKGTCSDVERYITVGIMWDCSNLGNFDEMKHLIKKVGNNVSKDYIFQKLLYYYNNRVISGSKEEEQYKKLFIELEAKDNFLPFLERKKIEARLKKKKK